LRALVTGFEPFGGETINPSAEALRRLPSRLGALQIETAVLPASFERVLPALDAALGSVFPDIVLAVGQASERMALSLERVAINVVDSVSPDNDGRALGDRPVLEGGPAAYFATLPVKAALAALRAAGLPAELSNSAGTFVCNQLFYGLLHRAERRAPGCDAGFLHVPLLPQQAARHVRMPSLALEHVVQGIEIILAVTAERRLDMAAIEDPI
jgi:pyroglutamyl-peptidase